MKLYLYILIKKFIRLFIPASLFIAGFYLISLADTGVASLARLFISMACFVTGAILIAEPVAKMISRPFVYVSPFQCPKISIRLSDLIQ